VVRATVRGAVFVQTPSICPVFSKAERKLLNTAEMSIKLRKIRIDLLQNSINVIRDRGPTILTSLEVPSVTCVHPVILSLSTVSCDGLGNKERNNTN
jgi:hypothetical protein